MRAKYKLEIVPVIKIATFRRIVSFDFKSMFFKLRFTELN
tara:strand:- start:50 stop:169 length:120 start_codon:yes stop_codon:yes gene_type:complete